MEDEGTVDSQWLQISRGLQVFVQASHTGVTVLCPLARHINPSLVLVQPRKTLPT